MKKKTKSKKKGGGNLSIGRWASRLETSADIQAGDAVVYFHRTPEGEDILKICDATQKHNGVLLECLLALQENPQNGEAVINPQIEGTTVFMSDEEIAEREVFKVDFRRGLLALLRHECSPEIESATCS